MAHNSLALLETLMYNIYYPDREIVVKSSEHILLNALGGQLESLDLIDKPTNDRFGHTIDAALERGVGDVRVLVGGLSGEGEPPPELRRTFQIEGRPVKIGAEGQPRQVSFLRFEPYEGGVTITGSLAPGDDPVKVAGKRALRKYNIPEQWLRDQCSGRQPTRAYLRAQSYGGGFDIEACRALAKMACNLFALAHRDIFLRADFDPIRRFVADGAGRSPDFVVPNADLVDITANGRAMGPLDHLLLIRGHAETGRVEALVALYGHIQFVIRLGQTALPFGQGNILLSYRVDQIGHAERRDHMDDLSLIVPNFESSRDRNSVAATVATQGWRAIFDEIWRQQCDGRMNEIRAECAAELFPGCVLGELSAEELGQLTELAAQRYAADFQALMAAQQQDGGVQ